MKQYRDEDFAHYEVTWSNGYVGYYGHHKSFKQTEEDIKKGLSATPGRDITGKPTYPVRVKRTK